MCLPASCPVGFCFVLRVHTLRFSASSTCTSFSDPVGASSQPLADLGGSVSCPLSGAPMGSAHPKPHLCHSLPRSGQIAAAGSSLCVSALVSGVSVEQLEDRAREIRLWHWLASQDTSSFTTAGVSCLPGSPSPSN
jgi:hypothetical protein